MALSEPSGLSALFGLSELRRTSRRRLVRQRSAVRILAWLGMLGLSVVSLLVTAWLVVHAVAAVQSSDTAPWTLGRASGLTAYALLVLLVSTGLVLAHPAARRLARPRPLTRLRVHVSLAVFTLAFTLLHVVVLATDPWAGVGWRGALLPMASAYRPVGVTLGVIAVWAGLVTGVTAALAGRVFAGVWWPVHKVAAAVLALVWVHGVVAGWPGGCCWRRTGCSR